MYLYIQVTLFIRRTVRSIKKTSTGGRGGIQPVVGLTECKAFITVTFDHFHV